MYTKVVRLLYLTTILQPYITKSGLPGYSSLCMVSIAVYIIIVWCSVSSYVQMIVMCCDHKITMKYDNYYGSELLLCSLLQSYHNNYYYFDVVSIIIGR